MGFGEIIKEARKSAKLSQVALGSRIGVTGQAVGQWESGEVLPRGGNAQKLIDVLGIDPHELIASDPSLAIEAGIGPGKVPVSAKTYTAPLYDASSASFVLGEATVLGQVPVPEEVLNAHPGGFFLMVQGDRVNRVMASGCYALIDPAAEVENNDLAAIVVGTNPALIARFHRLSNSVVLSPDSTDESFRDEIHDTTTGADVQVLGRVVWFGAPYGARL